MILILIEEYNPSHCSSSPIQTPVPSSLASSSTLFLLQEALATLTSMLVLSCPVLGSSLRCSVPRMEISPDPSKADVSPHSAPDLIHLLTEAFLLKIHPPNSLPLSIIFFLQISSHQLILSNELIYFLSTAPEKDI